MPELLDFDKDLVHLEAASKVCYCAAIFDLGNMNNLWIRCPFVCSFYLMKLNFVKLDSIESIG